VVLRSHEFLNCFDEYLRGFFQTYFRTFGSGK
jgi:hypothetical protein